jgi:hypothetical protein
MGIHERNRYWWCSHAASSHPDDHNQSASFSPPYVANVCFNYCRYFRGMLQVFCIDVAKVDWDICIRCNGYTCMLQAFVSNVSSIFSYACCKCFYLDVTYVLHICLQVFLSGCRTYMFCNDFSSVLDIFRKCFRRMFQVFHLSSDICCKNFIWMFQK